MGFLPCHINNIRQDEGGCHSTYSISQAGLKYGQLGHGRVFVGECRGDRNIMEMGSS